VGSVARYLVGSLVYAFRPGNVFPYETLVVNAVGCVGIGLLAGLAEGRGLFAGGTRVFLLIGVLGGFTTFSSFGYETFQLLRGGQFVAAATSVALQLVLGLGGVWAGDAVARLV
jgi:CrcB protein